MALTAANVISRASRILQDLSNVRWSTSELLGWLNDGRREMAVFRPDLYSVVTVVALVSGTRQSIPTAGMRFLDAYRNINADDSPGTAIRLIQREDLDSQYPGWHGATPGVTANFMHDERVPRVYWVYPPAVTNAKLEISYAQEPSDITTDTTELTQEGPYSNALVDYLCYRAFVKDATFAGNLTRAAAAYAQFKTLITDGDARDITASPNTARVDGNQPKSGG